MSFERSIAVRPCPGEQHTGDAAVVRDLDNGDTLAGIVDVTGHGFAASRTAARIVQYLNTCRPADPLTLMARLNELIENSEGAAIGLCIIHSDTGRLDYAGAGNTVIRRVGSSDMRLVSWDGIVGVRYRPPKLQSLMLVDRDLVLMYTDGVGERMSFDDHDGSRHVPTSQIARTLVEKFGKSYDDAGCLVLRYRAQEPFS